MLITTYLKVTKSKHRYGSKGSVKLFTKKPSCASNEVALRLEINLPDALFDRPEFKVQLHVDPKDVGTLNPSVTIDTKDIAKILRDSLGVNVLVSTVVADNSDTADKLDIVNKMGS